jgi:hypothetical protein
MFRDTGIGKIKRFPDDDEDAIPMAGIGSSWPPAIRIGLYHDPERCLTDGLLLFSDHDESHYAALISSP